MHLLIYVNRLKIWYFYRGSRPVTSSKPASSTKTVVFDLPPWQNQPTENGDAKIEVSSSDYLKILLFK